MKKLKLILLAAVMIFGTIAMNACGNDASGRDFEVTHKVEMTVKDMGTVTIELYGKLAPKTVENFVSLVEEGFYDGLTFHRVISGFMIQGGDPEGTGFGGSGKAIIGEFTANGFENNLSHDRGVISMARRGDSYDSATSQFFICHTGDYKHSLDGQYASFGRVTDGMDVVDAVAAVATGANDKPLSDVIIESVKIVK